MKYKWLIGFIIFLGGAIFLIFENPRIFIPISLLFVGLTFMLEEDNRRIYKTKTRRLSNAKG